MLEYYGMLDRRWVNEGKLRQSSSEMKEFEVPLLFDEYDDYLLVAEWFTEPNGEGYLVHVYKRGEYFNGYDLKKEAVLFCDDVYDEKYCEYVVDNAFVYARKYIDTMLL